MTGMSFPRCLCLWCCVVSHTSLAARLDRRSDLHNSSDAGQLAQATTLDDAIGTSLALWEHMEVRDCLKTLMGDGTDDVMSTWEARIQRIWDLELKLTFLDLKSSLLGYVKTEIQVRISEEAARRKQALQEAVRDLYSSKAKLLEDGFDYDLKKEACIMQARPRLQQIRTQVSKELSEGCSGGHTKFCKVSNQCRELSNMCPEGTHCSCTFSERKRLAAAVGPIAYLAAWGALTYFVPGGALMPGPLEFSMLTSFLVATKSEGCRCTISPCAWDEDRRVCAPKPAIGAKNPFQSVLPYLGQACVPRTTFWHQVPGLSELISPGCEARLCLPEDEAAVGPVGDSTFNCQLKFGSQFGKESIEAAPFPSKLDRLQDYMSRFKTDLSAYHERNGAT